MSRIANLFDENEPQRDAEARRMLEVIFRCDKKMLYHLLKQAHAHTDNEPSGPTLPNGFDPRTVSAPTQRFSVADLIPWNGE